MRLHDFGYKNNVDFQNYEIKLLWNFQELGDHIIMELSEIRRSHYYVI